MAGNEADAVVVRNFEALIREEDRWLEQRNRSVDGRSASSDEVREGNLEIRGGATEGEPWVEWTTNDRFGIALSGGGIRSATFNLGLLQALARSCSNTQDRPRGVLDLVDYVATVSGGGYVGGFWTRWLHHGATSSAGDTNGHASKAKSASLFPALEHDGIRSGAEHESIRHLRERSRFLMPRIGVFEVETWSGGVAVLGAVLPSLLIATALLLLGWYAWLGLRIAASAHAIWSPLLLFAVSLLHLLVFERMSLQKEAHTKSWTGYALGACACSLLIAGLWYATSPASSWGIDWLNALRWTPLDAQALSESWRAPGPVVDAYGLARHFASLKLMLPALPFAVTALVLIVVVRTCCSRWLGPAAIAVVVRLTARCLKPALAWCGFAGLWWFAVVVSTNRDILSASAATGALTGGAAGLFVWLRDWLNEPVRQTRADALFEQMRIVLKPVLPQVLAYVVALGMLVLSALAVVAIAGFPAEGINGSRLLGWGIAAGVVLLLTLVLIDPARIGLHEFYRSRLAETFLGAVTGVTKDGDITLRELSVPRRGGPLHLICTTGNDLAGDPLRNLYRGGRSVVVSPLAIAAGDHWVPPPKQLRLSSVLTASAAAFNAHMGSVSKRLGPSLAFIMSALGLRLGLWVKHPKAECPCPPRLPGWYLFKEMFGASSTRSNHLHLSDGGHFENLALYELLRRRCRYVLISDCGADPDTAFDDLANATRLAREDFGIEIELDVEPLRPNERGLSRQHAVVGTIHYGGIGGSDKGILIYFKPTLVGDEPTDVTQYRARNPRFPHESTTDQFYDEAQWESYRRLGQHCGGVVFRFIRDEEIFSKAEGSCVERVFLGATQRWQHLREVDGERLAALAARRDSLLGDIQAKAPALYGELFALVAQADGTGKSGRSAEHSFACLQHCVELTSLMDQVFEAARLETQWAHQRNQVWMNLFHLIAGSPSFQQLWPFLRPLCGNGLRDFAKLRLGLRMADREGRDETTAGAVVTFKLNPLDSGASLSPGYTLDRWNDRGDSAQTQAGMRALEYVMIWPGGKQVVVGFLLYRLEASDVRFRSTHLFVPLALEGAGIVSRLLDAVIAHFTRQQLKRIVVELEDAPLTDSNSSPRFDPAHRQARADSLHFYKSRGFVQQWAGEPSLCGGPRNERHVIVRRLVSPSPAQNVGGEAANESDSAVRAAPQPH